MSRRSNVISPGRREFTSSSRLNAPRATSSGPDQGKSAGAISFQVSSRVHSRTILGSIGAERLLGAGDMLFIPPGRAKLRRLYDVSESELRRICDFLRAQGAPDYQMQVFESSAAGTEENSAKMHQRDPLYDEAVRIVLDTGQASIPTI